jgi:hypothetical protein
MSVQAEQLHTQALETVGQEPMAQELSLRDRILQTRTGRAAATLMAGLSIGAASELATSASASAQETPVAHMASHTWSVLGGDPLVPGGVHSRSQLKSLFESPKGRSVLSGEGLSSSDISAVENAISHNKETDCTLNTGDHFIAMGFGQFGEVETDVNYVAGSAPAYCLDVRNGNKEIFMKIPQKCANIALEREVVHKPKKHPKQKTAEVQVVKIAEDDQGHQLPATPTGTFDFEIKCKDGSKKIDHKIVYNQTPQPLAQCNVGSKVEVDELSPLSANEQWKMLSNADQHQTVSFKGNKFVFKDQEVTPPVPVTPPTPQTPPAPTPPQTPPVIIVIPPTPPAPTPTESLSEVKLTTAEPVFPNSPEQLCVNAQQINVDSSGNQSTSAPNVAFAVASGEGTVSSTFDDQDGNPNHLCATFTSGPDFGQTSVIDATATSNDGGTEPPVVQQFTIAVQQDTGF